MHNQWLYVPITALIDHNKAADRYRVKLLHQSLIREVSVDVVVLTHNKALEIRQGACPHDTVLHVGDQAASTILVDAENAFYTATGAVGLIPLEDSGTE